MAGAPLGNQNARKAKLAHDALHRRMVARYGSVEAGYDAVADKRLDAMEKGEPWSVQDIVQHTDGKPAQSHEIGGPDGGPIPIAKVVREIVRPKPEPANG